MPLNLTTLRVQANDEFKLISFKNVPKLNEVSLGLTNIVENRGPCKDSPLVKYLHDMPKVKKLFPVPMKLPIMADHLKKLELQQLDFRNFDEN
ncbi:hypothetical protein LguiB_025044 [Lonicera macranthoides]